VDIVQLLGLSHNLKNTQIQLLKISDITYNISYT